MRDFLVAFSRARSAPDVSLDDLPSQGGRFDLVCRTVSSALLVSNGMRRDTRLTLVLEGPPKPPLAIRLRGDRIKNLHPDERSIAAWLSRSMHKPAVPGAWLDAGDGIEIARTSASELVEARGTAPLVVLVEDGEPLERARPLPDSLVVLGDDRGFSPAMVSALVGRPAARVSLGPVALHTDQCVTVLHHWWDRIDAKTA